MGKAAVNKIPTVSRVLKEKLSKEDLIDLCGGKEGYTFYRNVMKELKSMKQEAINAHPEAVWLTKEAWNTVCHNILYFACLELNKNK